MQKILLGQIVGVFGIKGYVKVISFTQKPSDICTYGALCDEQDNTLSMTMVRFLNNRYITARIHGVDNRADAQNFVNKKLFVSRDQLPNLESDEFYFEDIIGLPVCDENGINYGVITDVREYGAGPFAVFRSSSGKTGTAFLQKKALIDVKPDKVIIHAPYIIN